MGDISAEPSMEEILSSIKRIIAEEGEGTPQRPRRPQRAPTPIARQPESEEVLELSEPMPLLQRAAMPSPNPAAQPSPAPAAMPAPEPRAADPIVSHQAAAASRGSLEALTRMVVRPESAGTDNTLEGLVRDMLRPMLREWLDARLPDIVEAMVSREIERITGARG